MTAKGQPGEPAETHLKLEMPADAARRLLHVLRDPVLRKQFEKDLGYEIIDAEITVLDSHNNILSQETLEGRKESFGQ